MDGGLPLGLSAEFGRLDYPVTTVELDPGETLLLCTDGLVEQPGADLDDGMRTLTALIAQRPAATCRSWPTGSCDVVEERGGDDDVALLLLRRRGLGRPAARRPAPAARRARATPRR